MAGGIYLQHGKHAPPQQTTWLTHWKKILKKLSPKETRIGRRKKKIGSELVAREKHITNRIRFPKHAIAEAPFPRRD